MVHSFFYLEEAFEAWQGKNLSGVNLSTKCVVILSPLCLFTPKANPQQVNFPIDAASFTEILNGF